VAPPSNTLPRRRSSRRGFSMLEAVIASSILAFAIPSAVAGMIFVRRSVAANNLRAIAIHAAQRSIESLRAMGAAALGEKLQFNGVAENGFEEVWEADAVALGLVAPTTRLRALFEKDAGSGEWREDPQGATTMALTATLVANGDSTGRTENLVRVYLDFEWASGGRMFREALFAVIY
jgi:type II secretory pathway pseudopilin PulG